MLSFVTCNKWQASVKSKDTKIQIFNVNQYSNLGDGREKDFILLDSKVEQCAAQRVHAYEIPVGH
jgi:hypothetical protein